MACQHENFAATVNTNRLTASDDDPAIVAYMVEIQLCCHDCGLPFRWVCPDVGCLPDRPATDAKGEMLNVYAEPSDGGLDPKLRPAGYRITHKDVNKPGDN